MLLPTLAPLLFALIQDTAPPAPEIEPIPVLRTAAFRADVDLELGRLELQKLPFGEVIHIPLGIELRPSSPPARFSVAKEGEQVVRPSTTMFEEGAPTLDSVLLEMNVPGVEGSVHLGIRAGPYGPYIIYGLPRDAFDALRPLPPTSSEGRLRFDVTSAGKPPQLGGMQLEGVLSLDAPSRVVLPTPLLAGLDLAGTRLRGQFGIDDASGDDTAEEDAAVRLRIVADGARIYDSGEVTRESGAKRFDVALVNAREFVIEIEKGERCFSDVIVDLFDVDLHGAGKRVAVIPALRATEPGIDFFVDPEGHGITSARLHPRASDRIPQLEGRAGVDVRSGIEGALRPGPLFLPFQLFDGSWVGVGLGYVPDATRFGFEGGRIALAVPMSIVAGNLGETDQLTFSLFVVVADSRGELFERARETMIATGASVDIRRTGGVTVPKWWRNPCVFAQAPRGRGRFSLFDPYSVNQFLTVVEEEIGIDRFTLVIDGAWNELAGDPNPSEAFSGLRGLIADQHVRGRHVLLRWNLTEGALGSFAWLSNANQGDSIDATNRKSYRAYASEIARRCLSDQLGALGADGLLLVGLDKIRDPTDGATYAESSRGMGLRELELALEGLSLGVRAIRSDALLLSAAALPQWVEHCGGLLVPSVVGGDLGAGRVDDLLNMMPDHPLYFAPSEGSARDVLKETVLAVLVGIPSVGSRTVAHLDVDERAALGALMRLAAVRPLGLPVRDEASGDWSLALGDRRFTDLLAGGVGVVVYPTRHDAMLAVIEETDVDLPFAPTGALELHGAEVRLEKEGPRLVGAKPGVVYQFSR